MNQPRLDEIDGEAQKMLNYDFIGPVRMDPSAGIVPAMAESSAFDSAQTTAEAAVRNFGGLLNTRVTDLAGTARSSGQRYMEANEQAEAELRGVGEGIYQ